ncbi:MAG TPA: hypothetical protein VF624_09605 [Tepidisphaeraceae bacterium]
MSRDPPTADASSTGRPTRLAVLLFTDVVGSTALKRQIGVPAYGLLLGRHHELFESLCSAGFGRDCQRKNGRNGRRRGVRSRAVVVYCRFSTPVPVCPYPFV